MPDPRLTVALAALPLILAAAPAAAYIGPGAGAGTIAVVLGILASVVMAFFAILYYPIKRMLKKKKAARTEAPKTDGPDA
ncbi:hypothetical protein ACQ5SO_14560 [Rhodovulum sp. DZ06]|uniref:hypothetical protein n=1 Tax=Rhodovulum sp. DZ06 TaxID=3425126 RepID=UPI003D3506A6